MKLAPTSAVRAIMLAKRIASKVDPGFSSVDIPTFGRGAPVERASGGEVKNYDTNGIVKSGPKPADYIESGSQQFTFSHPASGGRMSVVTRPNGPRSASVIDLHVPEEHRGTGIGKALHAAALKEFPSLGGQVSSKAAAKNAYAAGRRLAGNENASLEDIFRKIDEYSSANLWTPSSAAPQIEDEGKTIPESETTLEHQRRLLLDGRRKAVMYPKGGSAAPEPPEGAGETITPDGTFHFNPALVTEEQIHEASRQRRLNDVLGLGPYSKQDIANRIVQGEHPIAVVARDSDGHEVVSAAGTHATAAEQIEAMRHQVPEGGSIGVEHPEQVVRDRQAVRR